MQPVSDGWEVNGLLQDFGIPTKWNLKNARCASADMILEIRQNVWFWPANRDFINRHTSPTCNRMNKTWVSTFSKDEMESIAAYLMLSPSLDRFSLQSSLSGLSKPPECTLHRIFQPTISLGNHGELLRYKSRTKSEMVEILTGFCPLFCIPWFVFVVTFKRRTVRLIKYGYKGPGCHCQQQWWEEDHCNKK